VTAEPAGADGPRGVRRGAVPLLRPGARARAAVVVAVSLLLFAAANALWVYLSGGGWGRPSLRALLEQLRAPLAQSFAAPLSPLSHPWMIPTFALVLAAMVTAPLLTALLYRLSLAGAFVAVVALVGQAPVLALVLVLGCLLVGRTRLRSDLPFAAFLLGLVPVCGYFLLNVWLPGPAAAGALPLHRWLLYAPLLAAVVVSVLAGAAGLGLVRVFAVRPGAIPPVLGGLLAAAMAAFYLGVGPDELAYSRLVADLEPGVGDAVFPPTTLKQWRRRHEARGLGEANVRTAVEDDLSKRREALQRRCDAFLRRFGDSDRAAEVLWVQAQCASVRLDGAAWQRGRIVYTAAHVAGTSGAAWGRLKEHAAAGPHRALAQWRLGELALRAGRLDEAHDLLLAAQKGLDAARSPVGRNPPGVFRRRQVPPAAYCDGARFEARRLLWLMHANRVFENARAAEALGAMLAAGAPTLAPAQWRRRIEELIEQYADTALGPNLRLALVLAGDDLQQRAAALEELTRQDDADAAIRASYELGKLLVSHKHLALLEGVQPPRKYFRQVAELAPPEPAEWTPDRSPWIERARAQLALLPAAPAASDR